MAWRPIVPGAGHRVHVPLKINGNGDIRCLTCRYYRPRGEYGTEARRQGALRYRQCAACRGKAVPAVVPAESTGIEAGVDAAQAMVYGQVPLVADVETDLPPRLVLRGPWSGVEEMAIFPRGVMAWDVLGGKGRS